MKNSSAKALWGDFLDAHLEYASCDAPRVDHFCDNEKDANECLQLVLKGTKKAKGGAIEPERRCNTQPPKPPKGQRNE